MLSCKRVLGVAILVTGMAWVLTGATTATTRAIEERASVATISAEEGLRSIFKPYIDALNNYIAVMAISSWALSSIDGGDEPPAHLQPGSGEVKAGALTYAALGDSVSTGVLAVRGYVERHHHYMENANGAGIGLANLGVNGMTSGELLDAIREDEDYRQALKNADVITWNIGGNDFMQARTRYKNGTCDEEACLEAAVVEFKANWDAIINEILALRSVDDATIRTMNTYNPFVAEDRADGTFDLFKPYVDTLNAYMCETAGRHNIPCADVYSKFNGLEGTEDPAKKGYITFDGIHPKDNGHQVVAELIRDID